MRKIFITLMMASTILTAYANNKNREYNTSKMLTEQSVQAQIKLNPIEVGKPVTFSVEMTPACKAFHIECLPSETAQHLPSAQGLAQYLRNMKRVRYSENLTNIKLVDLGYAFEQGKSYTLLTLGYNSFGSVGEVEKVTFTIPEQKVMGNPEVTIEVTDVTTDKVTLRFTPNADVAAYGLCVFPKGSIEEQLQQYGQQMGFTTVAEMVKRFSGKDYTTEKTNTWHDLIPNTEYEFCVQAWDKNGLYTELGKMLVKTKVLGGIGTAEVSIKVLDFGGDTETGFYQIIEYTPNQESALHRDIIITQEAFNKEDMGEAGILKLLKEDQPKNPYWDQYRVDNAQWNAEPDTDYIAFSIAKNANGTWGPLAKLKFKTPAAK